MNAERNPSRKKPSLLSRLFIGTLAATGLSGGAVFVGGAVKSCNEFDSRMEANRQSDREIDKELPLPPLEISGNAQIIKGKVLDAIDAGDTELAKDILDANQGKLEAAATAQAQVEKNASAKQSAYQENFERHSSNTTDNLMTGGEVALGSAAFAAGIGALAISEYEKRQRQKNQAIRAQTKDSNL